MSQRVAHILCAWKKRKLLVSTKLVLWNFGLNVDSELGILRLFHRWLELNRRELVAPCNHNCLQWRLPPYRHAKAGSHRYQ